MTPTPQKVKLWSRNFTLLISGTIIGALGGTATYFALSFLVYEETQSTLASALVLAISVIPGFVLPLLLSPIMDRLPRKLMLVVGDFTNGALFLLLGLWFKYCDFNYILYLVFSLVLSSIGTIDELAYNSIFPMLIPKGAEEKGFSVSSIIYPLINVIMMPFAAILYTSIGVGNILIIQFFCSTTAAILECFILLKEGVREGTKFSLKQWFSDIKEAIAYIKKEKGIRTMLLYSGINNGASEGTSPIVVAFFSATAGFNILMYSFFTVAECIGRTISATLLYKLPLKKENKYPHTLTVYFSYSAMDTILLWLPYPFMLINRAICGFMGSQSFTIRNSAIQQYIPNEMRARIGAFSAILYTSATAVMTLFIGLIGDFLPFPWVLTICGLSMILLNLLTNVKNKKDVVNVYMAEKNNEPTETK